MLNFNRRQKGLTYLMAVAMSAAPVFHIGDTIEIETLLNGRNDKNFLSDQESIKRYVIAQLPKGTLGEVEKIQQFKPRNGSKQGNTGLYIKVTSGPNAGKRYWVLYRPDRNYVKLYDKQAKETPVVTQAKGIETRHDVEAVQDRQPPEMEAVQEAMDLSQYITDAGDTPKADCQPQPQAQPKPEPAKPEPSKPEAVKAEPAKPAPLPDELKVYLKSSDQVQSNDPTIQKVAQALTSDEKDELSKVISIHDWVASNIDYDTSAYFDQYLKHQDFKNKYDALSVLQTVQENKHGVAICSGYANLTAALLRASNIPARVVEGFLYEKGSSAPMTCNAAKEALKKDPLTVLPGWHSWVELWNDGYWVPVDTTGDAGGVDMNTKKFVEDSSKQRYLDPDLFKATHQFCDILENH